MPLVSSIIGVLPDDRAGVASGILNGAREVSSLSTPLWSARSLLMLLGAALTLLALDHHRRGTQRTAPAPSDRVLATN